MWDGHNYYILLRLIVIHCQKRAVNSLFETASELITLTPNLQWSVRNSVMTNLWKGSLYLYKAQFSVFTIQSAIYCFLVRAQYSHRIMGKGRHLCPAPHHHSTNSSWLPKTSRNRLVNIDEPHMTRYDLIFSVACASCLTIIYLH